MTLHVHTARIGHRDPDVLDITRKSAGDLGRAFAPSWTILKPAIEAMRRGDEAAQRAWRTYAPSYHGEMDFSREVHPGSWRALLARPRVVLVCYCANHERCHRTLLARDILPKLGAIYVGELGPTDRAIQLPLVK
jgi:uncharacterized protein YeaO (DUF488 family)